jgi:transcriptional regulator with XRE-family HTH domain
MALAIHSTSMKSFTLRDARTARGWTQDELAEKSGIDQTTISGLEVGRSTRPSFDTVQKLARALKLRPEQLVFGQPDSVAS